MEMNTQRRAAGLRDKIPDIQKTLDTVMFLESRKVRQPMVISTKGREGKKKTKREKRTDVPINQESSPEIETTFELNDTLFAKAKVSATDEVYLWLGVRPPLPPLLHLHLLPPPPGPVSRLCIM